MQTTTGSKHTAAPGDDVARAAYLDWLAAGKPTGLDQEFWLKAEERLHKGRRNSGKNHSRKS